jgi:hypothetical protein
VVAHAKVVILMLDVCPLCGQTLRNGVDGPQYIKYDPAEFEGKEPGETVEVKVFYDRPRLCFNSGNQNTFKDEEGVEHLMNPPCQNYYAIRGGTIENPDVIVETVTIEDN